MPPDESKMTLTATDAASVQTAHAAATEEWLDPTQPRANVVGMGVGVKWTNGQPTGVPALVVLVTHKVAKEQLSAADLVPATLQNMKTDVLTVGHLIAGGEGMTAVTPQSLTPRIRPAKGGYSVGHVKITAGTLSNRDIANALLVSEATVKTHLHRLMSRMDLPSRAEIGLLVTQEFTYRAEDSDPIGLTVVLTD